MNTTRIIKLIYIALAILNLTLERTQANGEESSGEYLQKAIDQLQHFNVPSSINIYDRMAFDSYRNMYKHQEKQNYMIQRINMNPSQTVQRYKNQSFYRSNAFPREKVDLHQADSEITPQYYHQARVPAITKVREPEVLGFTRAELAAMYKNALEKGSTTSLSSLTNAIASVEAPQVSETHVELPIKQPLYQYYFFPLKTFMSEFKRDHGYKTIPAPAVDNTGAAQTTQTQLANPLFVAISTFVTMAIVFMMSVLFLPKLAQLDIVRSRGLQDDFFYLSNVILNAINRYNVQNKYDEHLANCIR